MYKCYPTPGKAALLLECSIIRGSQHNILVHYQYSICLILCCLIWTFHVKGVLSECNDFTLDVTIRLQFSDYVFYVHFISYSQVLSHLSQQWKCIKVKWFLNSLSPLDCRILCYAWKFKSCLYMFCICREALWILETY